jgi:hypothetical protein
MRLCCLPTGLSRKLPKFKKFESRHDLGGVKLRTRSQGAGSLTHISAQPALPRRIPHREAEALADAPAIGAPRDRPPAKTDASPIRSDR